MNPETDTKPFVKLLETIGEFYDVAVSPARSTLFFGALREYDWPIVEEAFNRYLRSDASKYGFPKPQHIREIIEGSEAEQDSAAWLALEAAIRKIGVWNSLIVQDRAWAAAVNRVWGSWVACNEFRDHADAILWNSKRKDFIAAYRLAKRTVPQTGEPVMLSGYCEIQNRNSGFFPKKTAYGAVLLDGSVESRYLEVNPQTGLPAASLTEAIALPAPRPIPQLTDGGQEIGQPIAPEKMVKLEDALREIAQTKSFPDRVTRTEAPASDPDAEGRVKIRRQYEESDRPSETLRDEAHGSRERHSLPDAPVSGEAPPERAGVPIRTEARKEVGGGSRVARLDDPLRDRGRGIRKRGELRAGQLDDAKGKGRKAKARLHGVDTGPRRRKT